MSRARTRDARLRRRYISQRTSDYADCVPIAICNGLRFLGYRTRRPGTKAWEAVVDAAGCRYGGTTSPHRVAYFLGAKLVRVARRSLPANLPAMIMAWNPDPGMSLHAVCAVKADAEGCTLINYRHETGPLIERVSWGGRRGPPRLYSDMQPFLGRDRRYTTKTVDVGPFDRTRPWSAVYLRGSVYRIVPVEEFLDMSWASA